MKKILFIFLISILILISNLSLAENSENNELNLMAQNTLYVGGSGANNYSSIQEAINNANPKDKIFINSGVYFENLEIDKEEIILCGENKYNTILDGNYGLEDGISINAENVTIQGLTITNFNSNNKFIWDQSAIKVYSANCSFIDNIFIKNQIGLHTFTFAYNLTISDNMFIEDGIILANYFMSNDFPQTTIKDYRHIIKNNTVNGKPLYYITDKSDFSTPSDAGQIVLVNCTNVTIKDYIMSNNDFSMFLAYCSDTLIENNKISDTDGEILLEFCENVTIRNNVISNTLKAICIEIGSKNNIVENNDVSGNYVGLSIFTTGCDNIFRNNTVYNNGFAGIELVSFHGGERRRNIIENNKVYNNKIGVHLMQNSINNTIKNNKISRNIIGIFLQDNSEDNLIESNKFENTLIDVMFLGCNENHFNNNYWGRSRVLPKAIFGLRKVGMMYMPWVNFDKNPA